MKNKKGFTLVELLAVIVILGVLLLIAVPAISNITADSKFNAAKDSALTVLEAGRTCSMATSTTCDESSVASYIDSVGVINDLDLGTPADNPVVKHFKYTENDYSIELEVSAGCTITQAKSKINALTRATNAKITSCS